MRASRTRLLLGWLLALVVAPACGGGDRDAVSGPEVLRLATLTPLERPADRYDLSEAVAVRWPGDEASPFWVEVDVPVDADRIEGDLWRGPAVGGSLLPRPPVDLDAMVESGEERVALQGTLLEPAARLSSVQGDSARIRLPVERRRDSLGAARVGASRFASDGFWVWPGEPLRLPLSALNLTSEPSMLRFGVSVLPFGNDRAEVRASWRLESGVEFDAFTASSERTTIERRSVSLPRVLESSDTLVLELEGPPCLVALHAPTLGPGEVAGYDARSDVSPPNIVVFLADTFRGDNLDRTVDGRSLTPNLDAFCEEALVFERAWSSSSWTLPSHASMFSSTLPHQHGATDPASGMPEDLFTLAESLSERGYRTCLASEGGFVSDTYQLGQGFEWFEEFDDWDVDVFSAALSAIEADDGRPLFLFFHTYRTHTPYRVTPETRAAFGQALGFDDPEQEALHSAVVSELGRQFQDGMRHAGEEAEGSNAAILTRIAAALAEADWPGLDLARVAAVLEAYYLGAVVDLDRIFAGFRAQLVQRGLGLDRTLWVFTSDHGEAFGEEGVYLHGHRLPPSVVEVPLVLAGPGVEPGRTSALASTLDLAPTIAAHVGARSGARWEGVALLEGHDVRPLVAQDASMMGEPELAIREVGIEVHLPADPARLDGAELWGVQREPTSRRTAVDVLEEHRGRLEHYLTPIGPRRSANVDAGRREQLQKLGYGG